MIRRDDKEGWILINQHDHAELSSKIMKRWGNENFTKPNPYDEIIFAIREHDNGWKEWDSSPEVNHANKYPKNFLEMSPEEQTEIWRRCFKRHSMEHPYASALIALHFGKLNEKSLGKNSNNNYPKILHKEIINFVSNMLNVKTSNLDLASFPNEVEINLRLVQIGDIISLALCHGWLLNEINYVPLNYESSITTLRLKSNDGINFTITPYPFSTPSIRLQIQGRRLNQKKFSKDSVLRQILPDVKYQTLEFEISKG
jgi:hypothetical protein